MRINERSRLEICHRYPVQSYTASGSIKFVLVPITDDEDVRLLCDFVMCNGDRVQEVYVTSVGSNSGNEEGAGSSRSKHGDIVRNEIVGVDVNAGSFNVVHDNPESSNVGKSFRRLSPVIEGASGYDGNEEDGDNEEEDDNEGDDGIENYGGDDYDLGARPPSTHGSHQPRRIHGNLNAVTDNYYDNLGTVTCWWSHATISDTTYKQLIHTCDFRMQKSSNECESLYYRPGFGNINQYNICAPPCNSGDGTIWRTHQGMCVFPVETTTRAYWAMNLVTKDMLRSTTTVRAGMHADTSTIPYRWIACSKELNTNWNDSNVSMLPLYWDMIAAGLRIWGSSVGTWTRLFLLQPPGGRLDRSLRRADVRGAGHKVPLFKPRAALQLLQFLRGETLPKSR
ncbi:hypothetical protein MLD38_022552 [Melastoma candidum]|uniref:Uncharacterized protein n=1 Tax=Melastoma candidum TaxID=119954 RepID=A0ACB9QNJ6_9MYRT|nr:hypothetical protein MLD38_022552 [Melastoma candidum]